MTALISLPIPFFALLTAYASICAGVINHSVYYHDHPARQMSYHHITLVLCLQVCATFVSHTVAAMVILPIVQSVGEAMPGENHAKLLVMAAGLTCSAAMGLPVGIATETNKEREWFPGVFQFERCYNTTWPSR